MFWSLRHVMSVIWMTRQFFYSVVTSDLRAVESFFTWCSKSQHSFILLFSITYPCFYFSLYRYRSFFSNLSCIAMSSIKLLKHCCVFSGTHCQQARYNQMQCPLFILHTCPNWCACLCSSCTFWSLLSVPAY